MPSLSLQIFTLFTNVVFFAFLFYYFLRFRSKEAELDKRSSKVDTDYHQVVDTALARERKIIEDATAEAETILKNAQFVNKSSTEEVNIALGHMIAEVQKEATAVAKNFMTDYEASLKQLSSQSLADFDSVAKGLKTDLQAQIKDFQDQLLPELRSELAAYKRARLDQIENTVREIVQKSAQEILNKALSLEDHQDLVVKSLEKAKQEGVFD